MSYGVEMLIVVAAGLVQSLTGFGFGLIAMPFFLLFHKPDEAVLLNILIALVTMSSLATILRRNVNWTYFRRLITGGIIGSPLGILLYVYIDLNLLKLLIGCLILLFTLLGFKQIRIPLRGGRYAYAAGMLAGFLTTTAGLPGPISVIYMVNQNIPKDELRATNAMCMVTIYGASLLMHVFYDPSFGAVMHSMGAYVLALIGLALMGQWLGRRLDIHLDQARFQLAVNIVLLVAGVYITGESIWELMNNEGV